MASVAIRQERVRVPPPSSGTYGRATQPPPSRATPYIVLVGLDLSEPGGRAWRFAFELAKMHGEDAEVHAVVVGARGLAPAMVNLLTPLLSSSAANEPEEEDCRSPLKVLQHRSSDGEARLMAMHFRTGRPDRAVVQLAKEIAADLVVVAKRPTTTLERLLGGSVADRIARDAPCPVVVVRPKDEEG